MKAITHSEFVMFARHTGPSVSIYLPLHAERRDQIGDQLLLAKALSEAERQLEAIGCSAAAIEQLLQPARELTNLETWRSRRHSMAILLGMDQQHCISLDSPLSFEVVADLRFNLRPLIPLLVPSVRFYLLTLSENQVHLMLGDCESLIEVDVPGLPENKLEAIGQDEVQRLHSVSSTGNPTSGGRTSIYHGQGGRPDTSKQELNEYVTRVAHAVDRYLVNESCPLILATTTMLDSMWRTASHYIGSLPSFVKGCADYACAAELHEASWPIIMHALQNRQQDRFQQLSRNKPASLLVEGLERVIPAACDGRVEMILIDATKPIFGYFDADSENQRVCSDPLIGDTDLIDLAAVQTVLHGGTVCPMRRVATPSVLVESGALVESEPSASDSESCVKAILRY